MNHQLLSMGSLALVAVTALTQSASHQEQEWKVPARSARKKNPLPEGPAIIAKGALIYAAQCVSCHGTSGVGDGVAAKDLEKHPGDLTSPTVQSQKDGALFWKITTGRSPMTAFGDTLSVEERWQVVRYIRTLTAAGPTIVPPELKAPESMRAPLTNLQQAYDELRRQLAKGDQMAASASIPALEAAIENLRAFNLTKLSEPLPSSWKQRVDALEQALAGIQRAKSMQEMRDSFGGLSAAAEAAWARFGHTLKLPLFVFTCSRATKAGAAHWVQATREPDNPYRGSKEVSCVKLLRGIAPVGS